MLFLLLRREYSCCFYCYVPQAICQHWVAKTEGRRWEEDAAKTCKFSDGMVPAFWSIVVKGQDSIANWLREWGAKEGYDVDNDAEFLQWLGLKVEWGGIEGNRLIQAFVHMARQVKGVGDEEDQQE